VKQNSAPPLGFCNRSERTSQLLRRGSKERIEVIITSVLSRRLAGDIASTKALGFSNDKLGRHVPRGFRLQASVVVAGACDGLQAYFMYCTYRRQQANRASFDPTFLDLVWTGVLPTTLRNSWHLCLALQRCKYALDAHGKTTLLPV
jgi:hypothetical protein